MKKMTTLKLAVLQLWNRKTRLIVQWVMVILGFGLISGFFTLQSSVDDQLVSDLEDVNQVWTAKGSPLQGLLANVYHMDAPLGNIALQEVKPWLKNPMVERASLIGYGDTYKGRRILGTDSTWKSIYNLTLSEGSWPVNTMDVVLSKSLSSELGLSIGDDFQGQHGESADEHHHEEKYHVVGLFDNSQTVADRLLITPLSSVWHVHHISEEEQAVTAVLVKTNSPMAMFQLPRVINEKSTFQAILPSIEVNRIYALLGNTKSAFIVLSVLFLLLGVLSISITLYEVMRAQQFDHTLLRVFGLSPRRLGAMIYLQAFFITSSGWVIGVGIIKLIQVLYRSQIAQKFGVNLALPTLTSTDIYLFSLAVLLALVVSVPVIIRIFKMTIHKNIKNA
ncbi:MAG: ABC transporter permease [Bacteroidetes bacterium]|nr:MAG: ABC transporter permease [Bacteroidota bacterium]